LKEESRYVNGQLRGTSNYDENGKLITTEWLFNLI
jgi:antitoxin component YwqK of YwqJK toxin-antitoxin module